MGASSAANIVVTESAYAGAFTETDSCNGIATVTTSAATGPSATYVVTGVAAGACSITFGDLFNQKSSLPVTVTTSGFVINTRSHR